MFGLIRFPDDPQSIQPVEAGRIGGKAASLVKLAALGINVPAGIILPTDFFEPWIDELKCSREWQAITQMQPAQWQAMSETLMQMFGTLKMSTEQRRCLNQLKKMISSEWGCDRIAIRSSSPDEDLGQDSFAGLYQTSLGVSVDDLESMVHKCAASALDSRVMHYKHQRGISPFEPRIAVVVQQQIDSDQSGVAFSVNPLTNDYDETLIEACDGLGEALVAGLIEPDRWVVNKTSFEVIEHQQGSRLSAMRLNPDGGIMTTEQGTATGACLTAEQLNEIVELVNRIEASMGHPVDVEWAIANEQLYALQARAITTWVPVPDALLSEPGKPRTLYLDAALSKGFTTNQPISPMGLSVTQSIFEAMGRRYLGRWLQHMQPDDAYVVAAGGRLYAHLSNSFWLAGPKKMSASMALSDALVARTLADIDVDRYRSPRRPLWARWSALLQIPALIWRMRSLIGTALGAFLMPTLVARRHRKRMLKFDALMDDISSSELPLNELMARYNDEFVHRFMNGSVAIIGPGLLAQQLIERLAGKRHPDRVAWAERLAFGLDGNRVVEMNLALSRMAQCLKPEDLQHPDRLITALDSRTASAACLSAHDDLITRFGCRGPNEVDIARSRYSDDPELLIHQVIGMASSVDGHDPAGNHQSQREGRAIALENLLASVGPIRRALIKRFNRVSLLFGGERDTPKHHLVQYLGVLRERALCAGQQAVDAGQLRDVDEVFMLSMAQLDAISDISPTDLEDIVSRQQAQLASLAKQVRNFPSMIDSRGRIPRPAPIGDDPSILQGMPISAGVVRGPVRIIQSPEQAHLDAGEILVAYTTDPGWTPLFINAAAIVLEVGGCLQHGAVVAREFGKPCVAGIDRVTTRLSDGQMVEVDGGAGTLRLL